VRLAVPLSDDGVQRLLALAPPPRDPGSGEQHRHAEGSHGHCLAAPDGPLDHYRVLGVSHKASSEQIKAAYRALVKRHHPDAGGDDQRILAINAAWEVLRDGDRRRRYDRSRADAQAATAPFARAASPPRGAWGDAAPLGWLRQVYAPIDRLLGQILNAFPAQLRALAADPYDDGLMETFCEFLVQSQRRMEQVHLLYRSMACPAGWQGFSLDLYHCLSQVQDALGELERYTMGYVDDYLRDGREMLREAGSRRDFLQQERRRLVL
jgi:molecular chaperone DnaJ